MHKVYSGKNFCTCAFMLEVNQQHHKIMIDNILCQIESNSHYYVLPSCPCLLHSLPLYQNLVPMQMTTCKLA